MLSRKFNTVCFLFCCFLLLGGLPSVSTVVVEGNQGKQILKILRDQKVVENYFEDLVLETAETLVRVSKQYKGAQVNGTYVSQFLNIYLIDGNILPNKNLLKNFNISLSSRGFSNAMIDLNSGIIFFDTRLMKSFLSYFLLQEQEENSMKAMALIEVEGLQAFESLWNPKKNSMLNSRKIRDPWLIAMRGALAFIIGHEMGHVAIKSDIMGKAHSAQVYPNKEDFNLHWACWEHLEPQYKQIQLIEREADEYAAGLLSKIRFPDKRKPLTLWYELGAHYYMAYQLRSQIIQAALSSDRPAIQLWTQRKLGQSLYKDLNSLKKKTKQGSIKVFYPRSHPAALKRVTGSLKLLADSPYSIFKKEEFGFEMDFMLLEMALKHECAKIH